MAWEIVANVARNPDVHLLVYLGMEPVVRQNPLDADCRTTMAMAEYRVGLYADAIESARRGASISQKAGQLAAQGLAVVAMSQHKMGQTQAAAETLRKLEESMKKPPPGADQTEVALRDEARKVLAAPVDKPWNERAAWDSCKARVQAMVGPAKCAIWQLRSLERKARGHLEPHDTERVEAARKEARGLLEAELSKSPDDGSLAQALADILLDEHDHETTRWTILEPISVKSQAGATLTKLVDHSILAAGVNPVHDAYTFVARTDVAKPAAFRLEAMADGSLPQGGPGRAESGNFALCEISVNARPLSGSGEAAAVKLVNPRADFEPYRFPVAGSLDGDPDTAWSINPQVSINHEAFFEVGSSEQAGFGGNTELKFTLDFRSGDRQSIGRFRLSVTGDSAGLAQEGDRRAARKIADPWAKLAAAYSIAGDGATAARWFLKALDEAEAYLARPSVVEYRNGRFHISRERPETALAAITRAIERQPKNLLLHYGRMLLLLASGDRTALRRACSDLLEQFRGTTDIGAAVNVATFCVLGGDAVADHEAVVRLAEFAVNSVPTEFKGGFMTTLGGALYRAGRFEESIRRLEEGTRLRQGQSAARDWAFLALAHHRLGHRAEARRWLDRLRADRANEVPGAFWNEWTGRVIFWNELATHLLRSEAEACILYDPIFPSDPFVH
jgi:tetratricopeptide (TPR) repeat protein